MVEEVVDEVVDAVEDLEEVSSGGGGPYDKKFLLRSKLVKLLLRYFLSRKCRFCSMKKMKKLRSEVTLQFIQPC